MNALPLARIFSQCFCPIAHLRLQSIWHYAISSLLAGFDNLASFAIAFMLQKHSLSAKSGAFRPPFPIIA